MTTLCEAIDHYVAWQRDHGTKFVSGAYLLNQFRKQLDEGFDCDAVTESQVRAFLAGNGTLTRSRATRYGVLTGFYRFAISRGYASRSPLPDNEPKRPRSAPPYIFAKEELQRLFNAVEESRRNARKLDAATFRTLILLLYGTGLRRGEACCLTMADVDLSTAVLTVRDTKFYRSRLVPVGSQLADALQGYATRRATRQLSAGMASSFFANRDGTPLSGATVYDAFAELLRTAGIAARNDGRRAPCVHSLRHSFAVHRLTSWYRQGADVQRLLPVLATYLGHQDLNGTQIYLSMTPELLHEASRRFEQFVHGESNE